MDLISIIQVIISILLVIGIIMQRSGAGIEGALGGGTSYESVRSTRRGFDKFIFIATIVLAVAFAGVSILKIIGF